MHSLSHSDQSVSSASGCKTGISATSHPDTAPKAGHGNDRVWKAWKAIKPAFHPSHTLWKYLQDSHITTASTTVWVFRSNSKDPPQPQFKASTPEETCHGCPRDKG